MPGIEKGGAILVHELHQREQDTAARVAERRCTASAETSAMFPFFSRIARQIEDPLQRKPNTLSLISDSVPTTCPSYFAHKVVVVGRHGRW
jgi:hypothetical protein